MRTLKTIRDWAAGLAVVFAILYFLACVGAVIQALMGYPPSGWTFAIALSCCFLCGFVAGAAWMALEIWRIRDPDAYRATLDPAARSFEDMRKRLP